MATRKTSNRKQQVKILRILTHAGALIPAVLIWWEWWNWRLIDPIRQITLITGKSAIILLFLSLAVTPLITLTDWKSLTPIRKPLGNWAFTYVAVHLSMFVVLDYNFDPALVYEAIFEKRYALVGFAAFLLLIPLAITSNKYSMKRLGKNWKKLHRLVYIIGPLALIHYFWLTKNNYSQPILFTVILVAMMALRIPAVKTAVTHQRRALLKRRRQAAALTNQP